MWKLLIQSDLRNLPKNLLLFCLLVYPIFAYIASDRLTMDSVNAFGLICISFLLFKIFEIYLTGSNLVLPPYVLLFGLFAGYTLICHMFVTGHFEERGIKYFYSDPIWMTFIALIIVENVQFSARTLKFAKYILGFILIVASIVSVIQISKPLFLVNDDLFVQGLSFDRMADYYENSRNGLTKGEIGHVTRFLDGYRLSIFSYINGLSVGIDTIAIFSILFAWRPINPVHKGITVLTAALVSFLSSSRWIILGFFIVAGERLWVGKNKLVNLFYFVFFSVVLLITLGLVANFMGFDIQQYISERLMSDSASTRLFAFEVFFQVFPDNPIFGTGGADTEKMARLLGGQSSQIHVGFLKLFYYYGLVGGLLYLSFMVAFLIRLRKMAKYSGYWGGFFAILAFFIANITLFELSLFYFGPLLAIIFANHFYSGVMDDKTAVKVKSEFDYQILN